MKMSSPPDKSASDYFRLRKYIGSGERKFISEAVFGTLRSLKLTEFCLIKSLDVLIDYDLHQKEITFSKNETYYSYIVLTFTILACLYSQILKFFNPEAFSQKLSYVPTNDFFTDFSSDIIANFNFDEDNYMNFIDAIRMNFNEFEKECTKILSKDLFPNEQHLEAISIRYSIPTGILKSWIQSKINNFSFTQIVSLAESLLYPAPLCLRVNLSKYTLEQVYRELQAKGISFHTGKYSPACIKLERRIQLQDYDFYRNAAAEVQDEASQLVAYAVAPDKYDKILDACAGAGGKSLHLADIQNDSGEILALDVEQKRLTQLVKRVNKTGIKSVKAMLTKQSIGIDKSVLYPLHTNAQKIRKNISQKHLLNSFDSVLIDAPCTGTGTARRTPTQKWKLNDKMLSKIVNYQMKLLEHYSHFVKPGGILVYSTCSLLPEENECVINSFLEQHNEFTADSLQSAFQKMSVKVRDIIINNNMTYITPLNNLCDGFFIARLRNSV